MKKFFNILIAFLIATVVVFGSNATLILTDSVEIVEIEDDMEDIEDVSDDFEAIRSKSSLSVVKRTFLFQIIESSDSSSRLSPSAGDYFPSHATKRYVLFQTFLHYA